MGLSHEMEITYGDHHTDAEMEDEDTDLDEDAPASAGLIEMLGFDPDEEPEEEYRFCAQCASFCSDPCFTGRAAALALLHVGAV